MKTLVVVSRSLCLLLATAAPLCAGEPKGFAFAPAIPEIAVPDPKPVPADVPAAIPAGPQRKIGTLDWNTDYASAYRQAKRECKMLFLFFRDEHSPAVADAFERDVLSQADLVAPLKEVVRAVLSTNVPQPVEESDVSEDDKAPGKLLDHRAFEFMYKKQGIAVIDLAHHEADYLGQVVSAHPFTQTRQYTAAAVKTILNLPGGTVTQRSLIFAVLMHPAAPISTTQGKCHAFLCKQARRGSELMAQYESVGHHDWGNRQNEIVIATGRSGMEVAASGWGQSTLIDAAFQCVDLWYGSPSHWGIMSSPTTFFGYDLVRSASGNWYGTGVYAN